MSFAKPTSVATPSTATRTTSCHRPLFERGEAEQAIEAVDRLLTLYRDLLRPPPPR